MKPLISVIIPCYNQAQYLPEALQSIINQTYINWECIIINDGSTDNTHEVATEWSVKDARFKYVKKTNGGLSSARNAGIDLAKGNWIQFLDSDDVLHNQKLGKSLSSLRNNEKAILITHFNMFKIAGSKRKLLPAYCDLKQEVLNFKSILIDWDTQFTIPIHCGLFPENIFETIRFSETLKAKEDWLFWIQAAQQNIDFKFLDEVLVYYRKHKTSMTSDSDFMLHNNLQVFKEIKKHVSPINYENFLSSKLEYYFIQNTAIIEKKRNKRKLKLKKLSQLFKKKSK